MVLEHVAARSGRLSSFLKEEMAVSTGLMNRLKWIGAILVNGQPQHTDYAVQPGDRIALVLDEPEPDYPAEDGALTVLYEDAHLLAVDKPSGMLIHPSRSCNTGTLANFVAGYFQRTGQKSAFHPVTRLDRDTFGIVLLAKNSHIHRLMQTAETEKIYHAVVCGAPQESEGVIDAPIARKPLPSLLRMVSPEGKPSVTRFEVMERLGQFTKLRLQPVTGRTHQLRVHCAYMGFPILGDPQYGDDRSKADSMRLGVESQLLCAAELYFIHPVTGEEMALKSSLDVFLPKENMKEP